MKSLNSQERKREGNGKERGRDGWGWCCDLGQDVRDLPNVFDSKACDGS